MPDDVDYAWLQSFIEGAAGWSESDLATARSLLEHQRRAVAEADPRDRRNQRGLVEVVDALERAIASRSA